MVDKTRALLFCAALLAVAAPAQAQTHQQWTIVATTETAPAAAAVQFDNNGDPVDCTGQNPDLASSGTCYSPLTITFDLVAPAAGAFGPSNAAVLAGPEGFNLLSLTNYAGSLDGGVTSIQVRVVCVLLCGLGGETDTVIVTVNNEDGSVFTFTAAGGPDPMTATFVSLGGSSGLDSGAASVYRNSMPVPQGDFTGSFENANTDSIDITFAGDKSNFSLNPVSISPTSPSNVCFTGSFSSADSKAVADYSGFDGSVSGDVISFAAGDGNGDVIYIQVTPDSSSAGTFQDPDDNAGTEYVTFYVMESANASCPVGLSAYDAPFRRAKITRPPVRWRRAPFPSHPAPVERSSKARTSHGVVLTNGVVVPSGVMLATRLWQ